MGLQTYHKKRQFDVTPEPRGKLKRAKGNAFVIQKHAARRLHYDLRLEHNGVMKSWAVTRGPSLVPGDKRLAVQVEDHPIDYNSFEGTIPEGQYGGGTVMIWDRGTWQPEGDPDKGLKKGHLTFRLDGKKLHGGWHLVRMHRRPGETKDNWLLIKMDDEAARRAKDPDILEQEPRSAATARTMDEIAGGKGGKRVWQSNRSAKDNVKAGATRGNGAAAFRASLARNAPQSETRRTKAKTQSKAKPAAKSKGARKSSKNAASVQEDHGAALPDFVPPSLATLAAKPPNESSWVHEIKFDGYRIQARLDRGKVRLLTRKGLDWTEKFPNIAAAAAKLKAQTALIDGEIVVEGDNGISSFSDLQAALKSKERERFIDYVFDLLHLDGRDLMPLPLLERKAELARLLGPGKAVGPLRYSEHFEDKGSTILRHACEIGLEGIVSKRADAPYRSGRSDSFIKTKCANAQEFVVGGYSPSTAMPNAIGALAVGYHQDGRLLYAGRIGTGYTHQTARGLWKRLHPLEVKGPPFDNLPAQLRRRRDIRWVKPELVIESQFRGWTADNFVRQGAFKGVREDKPAREVVRERPAESGDSVAPPAKSELKSAAAATRSARSAATAKTKVMARTSSAKASGKPTPAKPRSTSSAKSQAQSDFRFTHPERVYWADANVTKQDLAEYYRTVWTWTAPHVAGRPLALVRCPEGTAGECFFQKHASAGLTNANLQTVIDSNKRQIIAIEDMHGLFSLVQAGVLEIHVRGSKIERLDLCDRMVFDLDPGEDVPWRGIVAAAREVRERLDALSLTSFVKLTGGKGLHVVVPIEGADWERTKRFVQAFAMAMTADSPDRYVAKMTKSLRRGKIFVDYMRNSLEQTSVAAYSTRARAGAPVSAPVSWQELGRTTAGNQYTVQNLPKRLAGLKQDPWADMNRVRQTLPQVKSARLRG